MVRSKAIVQFPLRSEVQKNGGGGRGNFLCLNGDDENLKETFASAKIFTSFFFFDLVMHFSVS